MTTPLQPLDAARRLAWLGQGLLLCREAMPGCPFVEGYFYEATARREQIIRRSEQVNSSGSLDEIESRGLSLVVTVGGMLNRMVFADQTDGAIFADGTQADESLATLLRHFEPPAVPDMATVHPDAYAANLRSLDAIQDAIRKHRPTFTLADYQRDGLARAALRDGFVLAWETGLGKGLGLFLWSLLKLGFNIGADGIIRPRHSGLIVTMADLAPQTVAEALKYGIAACPFDPSTWKDVRLCITSYSALMTRPNFLGTAHQFQLVAIDEGTRIKNAGSLTSKAVRSLTPRFRAVATATPIKNRVPDLYWLVEWVAGADFESLGMDHKKFTQRFTVTRRNLTSERAFGLRGIVRKTIRAGAEACNQHQFCRLTAPYILRARKRDVLDMVPRITHRILVPMGAEQREAYRKTLSHPFVDSNGRPAIGAKLQALRQVAACPQSPTLPYPTQWADTPKLRAVLDKVRDFYAMGERVIVFSAFTAATDAIGGRLTAEGIQHWTLDGRTSPTARANAVITFKNEGGILLCGQAMSYGHNLPECAHLITTSKDWAMDLEEQAASRIHRRDSLREVHIWDVQCEGSIDVTLQRLLDEKRASAALALDFEDGAGQAVVNTAQLLRDAEKEFETT